MPIYEYECRACGHRLEKLQKINDAPLEVCPECAKPDLAKLMSAVAFRLKGGGWYETDFKSGAKKNVLQGADAGSDSSSSDSSGGDKSSGDSSTDSSNKKAAADGKSGDSGNNSNSNVSAAAN